MNNIKSIHLIERVGNFKCLDRDNWTFESGIWALSEETAMSLPGSKVYFHKFQDKPSYYGGQVIACRKDSESDRFFIIFKFEKACRDVYTGKEGWQMEKKLVA